MYVICAFVALATRGTVLPIVLLAIGQRETVAALETTAMNLGLQPEGGSVGPNMAAGGPGTVPSMVHTKITVE